MNGIKRPLGEKQLRLLLSLARRNGGDLRPVTTRTPDLAALCRKGLVFRHGLYERKEWNKTVATLAEVSVSRAGMELAAAATVGLAFRALIRGEA